MGRFIAGGAAGSFLLVLLAIGLTALSWLTMVLWPDRVARAGEMLRKRWRASMVRGTLLLLGGLLCLRMSHQIGRPGLGLIVLAFWTVSLLLGLPALFDCLGERLLEQANGAVGNRLRVIAFGAATVCAAGLLPWVGQAFWLFLVLAAAGAGVSVFR